MLFRMIAQKTRSLALCVAVLAAVLSSGCGARGYHYTVQAAYAFETAVGAFDDAEHDACEQKLIAEQTCAKLNEMITQILVNTRAAVAAIQAAPKDAKLPTALPDLLKAMADTSRILAPLEGADPRVARIAEKLKTAIDETLKVVYVFTGGPLK